MSPKVKDKCSFWSIFSSARTISTNNLKNITFRGTEFSVKIAGTKKCKRAKVLVISPCERIYVWFV